MTGLDRLIRFMLISAGVGLAVALCTWIFHGSILDHQVAMSSPDQREMLSVNLWSRPGPAVAVAALYPLFIRRLRQGKRSMYRRVVILAIAQILYGTWLVVAADYPLWLQILYVAQVCAAVAVLVAATRRPVRAVFGYLPKQRPGNLGAAWFLVIATPLIAELAWGSTPVTLSWLLILWVPVYGCGVLLIRELVCRAGRGWPSVLVLALAYEILEDGLGLQALTSHRLYDAADWGMRVFGVNVTYWEANAIYHAIFTVSIPIALTGLLFPSHDRRPWIGVRATTAMALIDALGLVLVRFTVPPSQDPGYQAPLPFSISAVAVVIALCVIALRVVPPRKVRRVDRELPALGWFHVGAFIAALSILVLTFRTFGSAQPAFTHGTVVILPMTAAAVIAVASALLIRRARQSASWTPRHTLGVVGGASVAHSIAGALIFHGTVERLFLVSVAAATAAALVLAEIYAENPDLVRFRMWWSSSPAP